MDQKKRISIIILILLIVLLGGFSLFVAIKISESNQQIKNSSANANTCTGASNCDTTCPDTTHFHDNCPASGAFSSCSQWATQACASHQGSGGNNSGSGGNGGTGSGGIFCAAGTCNDGYSFGSDNHFGGGSCNDRNNAACGGHGGIQSGGLGSSSSNSSHAGGGCTPGQITCKRDHPNDFSSLFPNCPSSSNALWGTKCAADGINYECTGYDACAGSVTPSGSCTGKTILYINSSGYFVGCNGTQNCFCPSDQGKSQGQTISSTSDNISCIQQGTSCAQNPTGGAAPTTTGGAAPTTTGGAAPTTTTGGAAPTTTTGGAAPTTAGTSPAPYCGDAICTTGEYCERTGGGASTFARCQPGDIGKIPTGSPVSSCYGVEFNQPVKQNITCSFCGDGVFTPGKEQCDASAPAGSGNDAAHCNPDCTLQPVVNQCQSLTTLGSPVSGGPGNLVSFTVKYKYTRTDNPYPNIRARVSTSASSGPAIGRGYAANSPISYPTNGYVSPFIAPTYDFVNETWTYQFVWEASAANGQAVAGGTYNVRVLTSGTDGSEAGVPCQDVVTVNSAPQNPLFSIVKQSTPICDTNGDAVVNYTIVATNIGPVAGSLTSITDTYDSQAASLGDNPSNITPSFGVVSNGVITWANDASLTLTPQQSKSFSYQLRIPKSQLINFAYVGLANHAQLQYSTNSSTTQNTQSFDLRTMLVCSDTIIPATGILDDGKLILIGLFFILIGYLSYKYKVGKDATERLLISFEEKAQGINNNIKKSFRPFEDSLLEKLDKEMDDQKEKDNSI